MNNKYNRCLNNHNHPLCYQYCGCQHCVSFTVHNAVYLNQLQNDMCRCDVKGQHQHTHSYPRSTPIHTGYPFSTVAEKIDFLKNEIKKLEQENV